MRWRTWETLSRRKLILIKHTDTCILQSFIRPSTAYKSVNSPKRTITVGNISMSWHHGKCPIWHLGNSSERRPYQLPWATIPQHSILTLLISVTFWENCSLWYIFSVSHVHFRPIQFLPAGDIYIHTGNNSNMQWFYLLNNLRWVGLISIRQSQSYFPWRQPLSVWPRN